MQSKCAWTKYNSHFVWKIYREKDRGHLRGHRFVRACAVEMHMDRSQEAFCAEFCRENAGRFRYPEVSAAIFPVIFHTKWVLCNVRLNFDCAGSRKVCFRVMGSVFLLNILLLNIIIFLLNIIIFPLNINISIVINIIIFLSCSSHLPLIFL